jgi:hypothetical protein
MFKKLKTKPFDINGDGKIDFDDIKAIFTGERYYQETSFEVFENRVQKVWMSNKHHFDLLSARILRRQKEGRTFYYKYLSRNNNKIGQVINDLLANFNDKDLEFYRNDFFDLTSKIVKIDKNISELKAASVLERQDKYLSSIKKYQSQKNELLEMKKRALKYFGDRFKHYGISLTLEQTEILMSRCDSHENSQMISTFNLIKGIVEQLALALKEVDEDLDIAKKYYSIFVGLLEVQMYIQENYIQKVNNLYLPGLQSILDNTKKLYIETEKLRAKSQKEHTEIYQQNLNSQGLTINVAECYCDILIKEKTKIKNALFLVSERHKLAINTLSTVVITAELSSLIKESENLFNELINLQTPEFEGFENTLMKDEFVRMTRKIQSL